MDTPKAISLNTALKDRFGIEVDFTADIELLRAIMEHYLDKRNAILAESGSMALVESPDYAKAFLITEAVRMFLREIAPRRMSKRKKTQGEIK